ncbi:MAG: tetratricopeptide repeat protein [Candidatus Zhuqueibacterota bacterium]
MKIKYAIVFLCMCGLINGIYAQTSPNSLKHEASKHISAGRFGEAISILSELISQYPEMADAFNLRGLCYEKRSQYRYAVIDFRQAVKLDPPNESYKQNLIRTQSQHEQIILKKIENYKRELMINPKLSQNYYAIGQCYEELDQWDEAENWYGKYFEMTDVSSEKVIRYAEILANNNQLKKGEEILLKFVNRFPNDYTLISRYGYFLMWLGKYSQAIQTFERALELKPFYKEAQDGLELAKGGPRKANAAASNYQCDGQPASVPNKSETERYLEELRTNPENNKVRWKLIRELMNQRQFEQAAGHIELYEKHSGSAGLPLVKSLKDSVYQILITDYYGKFEADPSNANVVMKLSTFYNNVGAHENAIKIMATYFNTVSMESDPNMAFRYAQHCAWYGQLETAQRVLHELIVSDPDNLDYQLLLGQTLVWSNKDLTAAQKYLENVHNHQPRNVIAILTLSSLHIARQELDRANEYLLLAKAVDPENREIAPVEKYYQTEVQAASQRKVFTILQQGRELIAQQKYDEALEKFDSYFDRVIHPPRSVQVEYAELNISMKNLGKAISIYDALLNEEFDFNIAVRRAKALLWNEELDRARFEFEQLCQQKPDHFECRLFYGDTLLRLKEYDRAREIYKDLSAQDLNSEQKAMVKTRFSYLPKSGAAKLLSQIPNHLGLNPIASYYSDNQHFQIQHVGGSFHVGLFPFLTTAVSLIQATVNSEDQNRKFNTLKGRLILKFSEQLSLNSGYGVLNTANETGRSVYDASLNIKMDESLTASLYYENTDGALILYSPFLMDRRFDVDFYKFTGKYQSDSKIILAGHFSYLSISDGNKGNDVLARIGKGMFKTLTFGYETQYLNYKYLAPPLPNSGGSQGLYYSPQNLDSHSLWTDWQPTLTEKMDIRFSGKVGYLPALDIILRQFDVAVKYQPAKRLVINAQLSAGSSFRFDSSYNYFSGSFSAYWSLF